MNLTSDQVILWRHGFLNLNETILTTWIMMFLMSLGAKLITRKLLPKAPSRAGRGRWKS